MPSFRPISASGTGLSPAEKTIGKKRHADTNSSDVSGIACWPTRNSALLSGRARSEEHTSELQPLMRISYAVFCLKNKTAHSSSYRHYTAHTTLTPQPYTVIN